MPIGRHTDVREGEREKGQWNVAHRPTVSEREGEAEIPLIIVCILPQTENLSSRHLFSLSPTTHLFSYPSCLVSPLL